MCTEHNYGFFIDKLSNWAAAGSLNHLLAELLLNTTRAFFFFLRGHMFPQFLKHCLMAKHYYCICPQTKQFNILEKNAFPYLNENE